MAEAEATVGVRVAVMEVRAVAIDGASAVGSPASVAVCSRSQLKGPNHPNWHRTELSSSVESFSERLSFCARNSHEWKHNSTHRDSRKMGIEKQGSPIATTDVRTQKVVP